MEFSRNFVVKMVLFGSSTSNSGSGGAGGSSSTEADVAGGGASQILRGSRTQVTHYSSLGSIEKLEGRKNYSSWAFAMKMLLIREGSWRTAVNVEDGGNVDPDMSERALATIALHVDKRNYSLIRNCETRFKKKILKKMFCEPNSVEVIAKESQISQKSWIYKSDLEWMWMLLEIYGVTLYWADIKKLFVRSCEDSGSKRGADALSIEDDLEKRKVRSSYVCTISGIRRDKESRMMTMMKDDENYMVDIELISDVNPEVFVKGHLILSQIGLKMLSTQNENVDRSAF